MNPSKSHKLKMKFEMYKKVCLTGFNPMTDDLLTSENLVLIILNFIILKFNFSFFFFFFLVCLNQVSVCRYDGDDDDDGTTLGEVPFL